MHWIELSITTTEEHIDEFSLQLNMAGAKAVTLTDAGDVPIYEPTATTTLTWPKTTLVGLFEQDQPLNTLITYLKSKSNIASFEVHSLQDEDWVRRSLDQFKPMCFGKRLWICPSWHTAPDSKAVNVTLDPGLAFGTGTHPTTALCLEWLDEHVNDQSLAIDYGCGSGILGIAAFKLGVKKIIAVDNDPQALIATTENAKENAIPSTDFCVQLSHFPLQTLAPLVLANILAQPLITLAPTLATAVLPGGYIVLSGILNHQVDSIIQAYSPWFSMQVPVFKEEWARLAGVKK